MTDILSPKQAGVLLSIGILGNKLLLLPGLVFNQAQNQSIFLIVFLLSIELLILYFVIKLKEKFYPLGFFEIFTKYFGKIFTRIIYSIFLIFFFLYFMYVMLESYNYLKEMLNEDAPILLFLVCVLPVINALVFMGLKSLGRTAQFYFWFIIVGIIVCLVVGFLAEAIKLPIIEFGFDFFPKSFNFVFWFSDVTIFVLFFDKLKPEKNYGRTMLRYVLSSMLIVVIFYFIYYGLFHHTTFMHFFAISDIVQFNVYFGGLLKLDIIPLLTIMFLSIFQMALIMYCCCECINYVTVPLKKYFSIVIVDIFILIYIYIFVLNINFLIESGQGWLKYLSLFCCIAIPLILFFIFLFEKNKKRRKYEKYY